MRSTAFTPVTTPSSQSQQGFETEFIQGSAIHPSLYAATIQVVGDLESASPGEAHTPIHEALNWRYVRFGLKVNATLLAALFLNEDGSCWQAKLDRPKLDAKKGKIRKYETPVGNGSRAFLPAIPPEIRQLVGSRYGIEIPDDWTFWDFVRLHPEIPIVLTEGGKKSLAALSQGYVTIALYGINAGVSKYETIAGERIRKLKPELIPDLQHFAGEGRKFILAFDQDAAAKTRYKVDSALADLSWHLEQAGCDVAIAGWDGRAGQCKGLDDLIMNAGAEAWTEAYNQAIPASEWRISRQLAAQVKRQADLSIGTQEFAASVEQMPQSGIVALYGGKGTGKSEAIKLTLSDRDWLSFTPLVSLGRDQAEAWGGVFINDSDVVGSTLLKDGEPVHGASVCIPSLLKVTRIDGAVLVLDELTATLEFLLGSKLANKNGLRPLLLAEFARRVQMADLVVLADADLTEEAIAYIETIRGERAFLVRSDRQALTYKSSILDCSINAATAALLERVEVLADDQLIYINSDGKGTAESLAQVLRSIGIESLLITSETSGGPDETAFLSSQGSMIPKLIERGIRAIITSPTVTQGFSIKTHTDRIDSVWGFYRGGSITAHGMAQALDRVRSNDVPRFVHVSKKGSAYSRLSKAQTLTAFMKEFKQISTAAARLVRHSLTPEAIAQSDAIDWQSQNFKMLASLEIRRNRGMVALRDTLVALLRKEGKHVEFTTPMVSQAEAQVAGEALKLAQQKVQRDHAQAIANATPIDEAEAKRLSDQTKALTPEQILSLEQWHLAKFYHLDTVGAEDVLFDRNGATQTEIRNLENALSHAKATEQTARSINQNPENPQDWKRTAVQRWLMEQSGMTTLIGQIVWEELEAVELETVDQIGQFIRAHAMEFRLGFGFSQLDKMSDQQIVGILLAHCGIKRKRHRRRGTYSIDRDRIETLLAILNRRQQADPYPLEQYDQSGVRIAMSPVITAHSNSNNQPQAELNNQFNSDVENKWLDDGESLSA
ncbi:MAG: hypothetical protein RLZZ511_2818 [Cyanobacteriota bacterium]|jgi:hypothetical protein